MTDDMEDVVREFLEESRENLDRVDLDLVALEKHPDSAEIIARIFRAVHTVKGTCGFLGFSRLEGVAHAGESVLSALRDEEIASSPAVTSVLLRMVDAIRALLAHIEATGNDGDRDYSVLVAQLTLLHRPATTEAPLALAALPPPPTPPPIATAPPPPPAPIPTATPPPPIPPIPIAASPDTPAPAAELASSGDTSIRVDVGLLDKLMNLVGELVLARNQIIQCKGVTAGPTFVGASQRLNLITSELQEAVMKTRMQPIGNIWSKFPRVIRDLALSCEKRVRLEMEGGQTELDKTLIEAIKDPLTHLVRNSVDHGIESPAQRLAVNKPAEGCLRLRAFHEGGQVNIEVSDDGGGLDPERIRQKAIERGIAPPDQVARMAERELLRLIFLPGFSTAAKVTNVSGRGVGMDVVLTNIERIGGTIELQSQRGVGMTVVVKIPLTLAIIRGLLVTSGDNRYAIPQASLLELVRLEGAEATKGVELLHGAPVYRLRGKLLPLVYLADALAESAPTGAEIVNIVVLKADERQFGLVVHAVHDIEEIVVKPLGKYLKGTSVFAGATIMGDGLVALILDIVGLAKRAHVVAEGHERGRAQAGSTAADAQDSMAKVARDNRQTLLLFRSPGNGRMAIPLARVERLEEFPRSLVEQAGHDHLVQYRGEIMPVIDLKALLVERRTRERLAEAEAQAPPPVTATIQVVVFSRGGHPVGLIVEQILDIVDDALTKRGPAGRTGMIGTAVILGRVTELLDVETVLRALGPAPEALQPELEMTHHGA